MALTVGFWHYLSGKTLTLQLLPFKGGAIINGEGDFEESDNSFYQVTVDVGMGYYWGKVLDSGNTIYQGVLKVLGTENEVSLLGHPIETMSLTAAEVWANPQRTLTMTSKQVLSVIQETGSIAVRRGDSLEMAFTSIGDLSDRSKLWFTVKSSVGDDPDSGAVIQIEETAGLLSIAGTVPVSADSGRLIVSVENDGDLSVSLDSSESLKLEAGTDFKFDIQMLDTDGNVTTLTEGSFEIISDVTRRVV